MAQAQESVITLKGSTALVTEFFEYGINSILYQRGVYPAETFAQHVKYGLNMLLTADEKLSQFLRKFLEQVSEWVMRNQAQKLVLVITGVESRHVLERWVFDVQSSPNSEISKNRPEREIMMEIQAVIRQITASVSFLPLLDEQTSFDLLVYTEKDLSVPALWEESDPRFVENSAHVRLRSFHTNIHKVDTIVAYRNPDEDSN